MKALHAGYVSAAVWDAIQNEKLSADLDWLDIVNRLSHFVIDSDVGGKGVLPPELIVLENMLCRGLPTLPSLFIEKELENLTGLINCEVSGKSEVSAFSCEIKSDLHDGMLPLLERALCVVAPECLLEPSAGFIFPEFGSGEENSAFDSQAEKQFWNGPLSKLLGSGGMQLAQRQRPLSTIVGTSFVDQRADVAVQFPGSAMRPVIKGIVLEVDGPTHGTQQGRSADGRRDEACAKVGWAQTYRHRLWQNCKASDPIDKTHPGVAKALQHPYLSRVNENVKAPLAADEFGQRVQMLVLFPLAVARIQRVILELVRGGVLSLDAQTWDLVVLDRDGLTGCGEAAAKDFHLWLCRIWAIYQPGRSIPVIRIHEIPQNTSSASLPSRADVLLDVSVQLRYGVSLPSPLGLQNIKGIQSVIIRSDYFNSEPFHFLAFGDPLIPQIKGAELESELTFFLQNIFRKQAFRPKQAEIIMRALRGESVIALLPTGAGKSITYQLPTLLQNGLAIVIDPIKSLMKDQVDNLQTIGISTSAFINSMTTAKERRQNTKLMQQGCYKFVFISPERFIIQEFRDALNEIKSEGKVHFAYAVVDEAHCVSEWGHDFRTAYLRVGANARRFCPTRLAQLPVLALTGTASYEVLDDIQVELGYEKDAGISVRPDSMERPNLKYRVVQLTTPPKIPAEANDMKVKQVIGKAKLEHLPAILTEMTQTLYGVDLPDFITTNKGSGLVFCPHARWVHGAEDVRTTLSNAFETVKEEFGVYYGSPEDRVGGPEFDPVKTQNDFKRGLLKVLACTKAFGMGIDKPDIRFTLHYNIPPSLESFYQEAGRSGRDGEDSQCWILYAGTMMPVAKKSLDFSLNYSFHSNTFPGAAIEEAKVFEILDENRVPGHSAQRDIQSMLFDETGIDYSIGLYHPKGADLYRIYINHPNYRDAKVYITIPQSGDLSVGAKVSFPKYEIVTALVMDWLKDNKPEGVSWHNWLFEENTLTVKPGIEELLSKGNGHDAQLICLSTDNGYLKEIAKRLNVELLEVSKAYSFVDGADDFIDKLPESHKIPASTKEWLKSVFPKIRQREHTFRAIYRLIVLGAVDDFVADYANSAITASLHPLPSGKYRDNLRQYIHRYAPLVVGHYLEVADQSGFASELRRCLHALIQFVYDRIAKQRVSALNIVEQTTVKGLTDPNAFTEAVTNFFDSGYLPVLRPHINDYTPELVFEICADTAAATTKLNHLLGACNRLIPENPDNAAFHALRAYAIALLGYREQDIKDEIDTAMSCFEKYFHWERNHKLAFLMRLRGVIAAVNLESARVFDAAIIDDHASWLRDFNANSKEITAIGN